MSRRFSCLASGCDFDADKWSYTLEHMKQCSNYRMEGLSKPKMKKSLRKYSSKAKVSPRTNMSQEEKTEDSPTPNMVPLVRAAATSKTKKQTGAITAMQLTFSATKTTESSSATKEEKEKPVTKDTISETLSTSKNRKEQEPKDDAVEIMDKTHLIMKKKACRSCKLMLGKSSFSRSQWKKSTETSRCKACVKQSSNEDKIFGTSNAKNNKNQPAAATNDTGSENRVCQGCKLTCGKSAFSKTQWNKSPAKSWCKECIREKRKVRGPQQASSRALNQLSATERGVDPKARMVVFVPIINFALTFSNRKTMGEKTSSPILRKCELLPERDWNLIAREYEFRKRSAGSSAGCRRALRQDRTWNNWAALPPLLLTNHAKKRLAERGPAGAPRFVDGTYRSLVATFVPSRPGAVKRHKRWIYYKHRTSERKRLKREEKKGRGKVDGAKSKKRPHPMQKIRRANIMMASDFVKSGSAHRTSSKLRPDLIRCFPTTYSTPKTSQNQKPKGFDSPWATSKTQGENAETPTSRFVVTQAASPLVIPFPSYIIPTLSRRKREQIWKAMDELLYSSHKRAVGAEEQTTRALQEKESTKTSSRR